ncbi:MAG: hypothetical protein M1814_004905 [Vezdaea aestivalis]|nr:MAG: hypothetical protein M1814_004905 [Vezdaea aestivalis]
MRLLRSLLRAPGSRKRPSAALTRYFQHRRISAFGSLRSPETPASSLKFGQPIHETHPHLIKPGDLTPGISALEYATRRADLAEKLPLNGVAILAAAPIKHRAGVVFYEFHQDSDLFYLTGFNEPEALAVVQKTGPGREHRFWLFVRPKDSKAELWEGPRSGVEAAEDVFNADETGEISEVRTPLYRLIKDASEVFTNIPVADDNGFKRQFHNDIGIANTLLSLVKDVKVQSLRPLMNVLRAIKSPAEIENMRIAGKASGRAFTEAMRARFTNEKHLAAFLDYEFKIRGCDTSAYVPVVAGGENALSIHYVQNNAILEEGDLVLVDAGGQYGGYVTDITRTWPTEGRFTAPQKDLYEAVLTVQRSCVSLCRGDANLSLDRLHDIALSRLRDHLRDLGFDLPGQSQDLEGLFPHHLGHFVGLDLHDTPGYSRASSLVPGQCITIEPGIYVPDDSRWPAHFRGMGIRIEDSVCIEEGSPYVLTTEAVKEIDDIEALSL